MEFFKVDREKCTVCGACSAVCPGGLIRLKPGDSALSSFPGAGSHCLNCGHCVAACPNAAMALPGMAPEQCPPIPAEGLRSPREVEVFLRSRRSIRNYRGEPVEKEVLSELIRLASHAPSGHNTQPLKWTVVYQRKRLMELGEIVVDWMRWSIREDPETAQAVHLDRVVAAWERGKDALFRGAPHLIVTHADRNNRFANSASTIALAYAELAAPSLQLGACWLGYFMRAASNWKPLQEALGFSEGEICLGALIVGRPQFRYHRLPLRNPPRLNWV